ncbi:MAG: hypothetical protein ABIF10_00340 [Candidatus Woesearchaeota archaeon]
MKVEISNQKTFIVIAAICTLVVFGVVIAAYEPTKGSHDTLWTDRIEPKTGPGIVIAGDVEITGDLKADQASSVAVTCNWEGDKIVESGVVSIRGDACDSTCCGLNKECSGHYPWSPQCRKEIIERTNMTCEVEKITKVSFGQAQGNCACATTCYDTA